MVGVGAVPLPHSHSATSTAPTTGISLRPSVTSCAPPARRTPIRLTKVKSQMKPIAISAVVAPPVASDGIRIEKLLIAATASVATTVQQLIQ